jgi:hypothetical protein
MINQDNIFTDPANKFLIGKDEADKGVVDFLSNTGDDYKGKTGDIGDMEFDQNNNAITENRTTEINILDKELEEYNKANQKLLVDPPEETRIDPPDGYEFKFFKVDNIRLPKDIKKQFVSKIYDADVKMFEISSQISSELKPKYDEKLNKTLGAMGGTEMYYDYDEGKIVVSDPKYAKFLESPIAKQVEQEINAEFNQELMSLLSVRTKDIYDGLNKSQEEILSQIPSVRKVNRLKNRMDAVSAPMDLNYYYLTQQDENYGQIDAVQHKINQELAKPNPNMDLVNEYRKIVERYWSLYSNTPMSKMQDFQSPVVVNNQWVEGRNAPKLAINSSDLKVGQQIYVGDGSKYIHYESPEGQDIFINAVNASSNYWSLRINEEPTFDMNQILGINQKQGVQIPFAQTEEDQMYASAKEKYGVDPRNIILRKVEGQPEQKFDYWDVIESGTFEVYGKKLPQFEIPVGNGKSIVPHVQNKEDYGNFLLDEAVVYAPITPEARKKINANNANFISDLSKAYVQYIDILSPNLSKEDGTAWKRHVANYMEYFDPNRLMEDDATLNSRSNFIKSMRVGDRTGPFNLPEYADKFLRWMIETGKYKEANEFSPTAMYNLSIQFINETAADNERKLREITLSNGMSGDAGIRWVNQTTDKVNEMVEKVNRLNKKINLEIEFIDKKLKLNPNDQELLKRRNSLALTSQNNVAALKTEYQNRSGALGLVNDPNFIEAAALDKESRSFKELAGQSMAMLKWEEGLKKQEAPSGEAKLAAFKAQMMVNGSDFGLFNILPDGASDAYLGFATGVLDRGLSFVNSTVGFLRQLSTKVSPIIQASGYEAAIQDWTSAQTEVMQQNLDEKLKFDIPETNADGTTNMKGLVFNKANMVGGATFDIASTVLAPEFRIFKGATAAAQYVNRLPGLYGMWAMGNFYNDYKEAEAAGLPREYRVGYVLLNELIQSSVENIINVKKFLPKGSPVNVRKIYGDQVRGAVTKMLSDETRAAGLKEFYSVTNKFVRDYFKTTGIFYGEEFLGEESLATLAKGVQGTGINLALNTNFDETLFSWEQQKDNLIIGLSLGSIFGVSSAARGVRLSKDQKYLHLSQMIDEFGVESVYNQILDIKNSGSKTVDVKLAEEMSQLIPFMASANKPSGMSNAKWLSVRKFVAEKDRLLSEMNAAPKSMASIYASQIEGIDAKISDVMNMSDDVLTKALNDVGVTVMTTESGLPYFSSQAKQEAEEASVTTSTEPGTQELTPNVDQAIQDLEAKKSAEISQVQPTDPDSQVKIAEITNRYDNQINDLKTKTPQYATQESQGPQQERGQQGGVTEYAPAQQGQQVQATQPTATPSDSDISRQREVVKANVSPVVQQIKALANNVEDGATFNSDGTRYTGGGVIVPAASRNTTTDDISDDMIADFANEHRALLDTGNFKIGVYKFPNSNVVSIDLNIVTDKKNLPAALEFAKQAGHESIFDMDTFENIKTGADGMNVKGYNPQQLIRAASDISQNIVPNSAEIDAIPAQPLPTTSQVATPTVTPPAFTPEDVVRMSDAKGMTYDQFKTKYPNATPESYDRIKESGYESEQDYDTWKQSKVDRANQIASDIRDAIANNRNGLTSVDMKNLSIDMQKAWSKIVPGLKLVWDDYERHVEEAGFPEEYKYYAGFFDPNSKVVYLNPNRIGLDTPIHEFGHVWFAVAKIVDEKLIEKGRSLIRGTEYEARVKNTPEYTSMSPEAIEEEALILAIGEKGAGIIDQMAKRNFRTWLNDLWKLVASKFGVKVDIENLTLEEFTNLAAMDILAGGGILLTNTNPVEVTQSGVRPSIVSAKKLATKSAEAFKRYNTAVDMQSKGLSPAVIWEKTGMENVQGEWMTELNYAATPSIKMGDLKAYFEQKKIAGATFKLSDVLSYPEFYSMYPKAKGVIIEIATYKEDDWVAAYNPYNNKMFLNLNDRAYNDVNGDYAAAILHEVQHYIQTEEGWRNGTSPEAEFNRAKDILSNSERKSGNIDVANTISGLTVNGKYEGEIKDLYDRVYEGARFMYQYNFGEVQARNVESRYVDASKRVYAPTQTQDRVKASVRSSVNDYNAISKTILNSKQLNTLRASLRASDPNSFALEIFDAIANKSQTNYGFEIDDVIDNAIENGLSINNVANIILQDDDISEKKNLFSKRKAIDYILNIGELGTFVKAAQSQLTLDEIESDNDKRLKLIDSDISEPTNIKASTDTKYGNIIRVKPGGHNLSFVQESDLIDIKELVKDIMAKGQTVWFWTADQLGRGIIADETIDGEHYLDAGPSYALDPKNRELGIIWATSAERETLVKRIGESDYIFIISGSPQKSKLFNKAVISYLVKRIEKQVGSWEKFRDEVIGLTTKTTKAGKVTTNAITRLISSYPTVNSLLEEKGDGRKQLFIALEEQRTETQGTPLRKYLDQNNISFDVNNLRDGFFSDNNFNINDVMLVLKPTGIGGTSEHSTYQTNLLGEVVGVPNRVVNAINILPDERRVKYKENQKGPMTAAAGHFVDKVKAQTESVRRVMDSNPYSKFMTQDANNYYFFHWSNEQRKVIDPNKFGNNRITSREERVARPSAAFFYTRPDFQEMGVGGYGHVVAIPKDKVYPATADPLNFFDEAKALFEKSHPGMAFGPNQQIGWITKVANAKGYEMVVAKWGNQLRAETTNKVKPEWYQMPDGWGIKTNPKYAKLKKGVNKVDVKPSISSRFGLEDGWGQKAVEEAFDMLRTGIFQIKENPSGGHDLIYNGGTIESGIPLEKAESFRDDMIKTALMKGYPQISEMTAENILFNAKRKNVSKKPGKKDLPENVAEIESTQFNNRKKSTPKKIKEGMKRWFVENFTVSQGAPKWMMRLKESRVGNVSYMVSRAESKVKDLKKAAKRIGFDDWKTFDAALRNYKPHSPSNPFWTGQQGFAPANTQSQEFLNLPAEMQAYVVSMRAMLDGISEQLVRNGLVSPDLALTLEDNMGNYVHRAYALYSVGQKWADKLRKDNKTWQTSKEGDDIIQTAKHNLVQLFAGHIMANNPNLSLEEVSRMANEAADVEIEEILQAKNPVLGSDESSFLPYRNTGTLQQRQEVPEWLRKLLGEFTDPGTAFLLSVSKSATLLHTSAYLANMRDKGMGNIFFEEGNRPQEASVRISAMNSAMLKPLDGLYTTPEMAQVLYDSEDSTRQGWPILLKVMNINKMMKTVYSPVTQAKNFFSNTFFAVNNGHFDVTKMGVAYKYFKGQKTEALMEKLKPLFIRGVLNQSLTGRELNEMFKLDDFEQYVLDNAEKTGEFNAARAIRKTGRFASRLYQSSDDFWKIFAYYNEQQDLSKAMFGKKYDDLTMAEKQSVDDESADRVMNTYPTYDRVLGIFKGLSRAAVFGNFIAFRAEAFRVFGNSIAYAYNDIAKGIKEKNPRMVAYGSKRLMGMMTYNAMRMEGVYWGAKYAGLAVSGVISSIWGSLFGGDDDDEERQAINSWTPSWAMSDCKIFDAKNAKDGKITFYPLGSIDPYAGVFNIFNAYSYGSEWLPEGGAKSAILEIAAPFVEPEMVISNIMSAAKNKDQYGWMIYNEGDDKFMQLFEGSMYVAKKTLIPGAYNWLERMFSSRDEEGNKVYGFNPEELYLAPVGRFYNVDMGRVWKSKLNNTKYVLFAQIESEFKSEKKQGGSFADQANFKWNREILRLHKMYKDGITLGYPEEKLIEMLKETKMERRVFEAIITGQTYQAFDKDGKITIERLNEMIMKGEMAPPSSTTPNDPYLNLLPKGDK